MLVAWEVSVRTGLQNKLLLPPPSRIALAWTEMIVSGEWFGDLGASGVRYLLGYSCGLALGIVMGLATARCDLVDDMLAPVLNFLRGTPSIALLPLAILWFGIGDGSKVFVVAWGVAFPIWLNAHAGIKEVDVRFDWAARSLGAEGWRLYTEIYLPGAVPFIIAGARMGIATAFFALAAAEMSGAFSGIAFRVFHSHQVFQTDKMMAAILTIGGLGLLADTAFVQLMRLLFPWWSYLQSTTKLQDHDG